MAQIDTIRRHDDPIILEKPQLILIEKAVRDAESPPANRFLIRSVIPSCDVDYMIKGENINTMALQINGLLIQVMAAEEITGILESSPKLRPAVVITHNRERASGGSLNSEANETFHNNIMAAGGQGTTHVNIVSYPKDEGIDQDSAKIILLEGWVDESGIICVLASSTASSPTIMSLRNHLTRSRGWRDLELCE